MSYLKNHPLLKKNKLGYCLIYVYFIYFFHLDLIAFIIIFSILTSAVLFNREPLYSSEHLILTRNNSKTTTTTTTEDWDCIDASHVEWLKMQQPTQNTPCHNTTTTMTTTTTNPICVYRAIVQKRIKHRMRNEIKVCISFNFATTKNVPSRSQCESET